MVILSRVWNHAPQERVMLCTTCLTDDSRAICHLNNIPTDEYTEIKDMRNSPAGRRAISLERAVNDGKEFCQYVGGVSTDSPTFTVDGHPYYTVSASFSSREDAIETIRNECREKDCIPYVYAVSFKKPVRTDLTPLAFYVSYARVPSGNKVERAEIRVADVSTPAAVEPLKVIFLDVDGVLSSSGLGGLCATRLDLFADIVRQTKAEVVLSSTWRHSHCREQKMQLQRELGQRGVELFGMTPILGTTRGDEISHWLQSARRRYDLIDFVILDDDPDDEIGGEGSGEFHHALVKCDGYQGLTPDIAAEVCRLLCQTINPSQKATQARIESSATSKP